MGDSSAPSSGAWHLQEDCLPRGRSASPQEIIKILITILFITVIVCYLFFVGSKSEDR